jgi:hypothetical protein
MIGNFSYSVRQRNNTIIHDFPLALNILDILLRNDRYNHDRFLIFCFDPPVTDPVTLGNGSRYIVHLQY